MPCLWNDTILQLLQVQLICYDALQKDQSTKPMLAEHTTYDAFCKMEQHIHSSEWIFRGPEPHVLLVHKPTKAEMDLIIKPRAV